MMYVAIVSLVNAIVNILPFIPASITTWIGRAFIVAVVVCMYQLFSVNEGYQKAWIMRASMLACNLITTFLWASFFLTLAASIFSIIAVYRECNAHSELIAEKKPVGLAAAATFFVGVWVPFRNKNLNSVLGAVGCTGVVISEVYKLFTWHVLTITGEISLQHSIRFAFPEFYVGVCVSVIMVVIYFVITVKVKD